jgi:hypothetical protein
MTQKRSQQSEQKMKKSPCSSRRPGNGKALPSLDTSHGLHVEGKVALLRLMAII